MNTILAQLRFNALDVQNRKMPLFREGQIFHGTVLKLMRDDLAVIEISRSPIVAKLEASLQSGQEYWFVVKKKGDTPTLQVLPSLHAPKGTIQNEKNVQHLLRQLGLPSTRTNIALVSHMQKAGIPFTKSFVQTVSSFMQTTTIEHGLEVLNIMLERKFPVNAQIFQAIHRFITADKPMLTQLQQITSAIQTQRGLPIHIKQLNEQLIHIMNKWTSSFRIESEQSGTQRFETVSLPLKEMLSSFGLQHEKAVVKLFKNQLPIQELNQHHQELKPILLALVKEEIPMQTKQLVQDTIQRLTGQQLLMKHDDQILQFLMQFPLPKQIGNDDALIQFQGKSKKGEIDSDFCRILFYLNLRKLRETIVDVHIQNRVIAIHVYNENHISNQTLEPFILMLRHQLERNHYTLSSFKWINETTTKKLKGDVHSISFQPMSRYEGVDIKI